MTVSLDTIPLERIDGSAATLGDYADKVLLIVNVASKCGLTVQYEGLEALYARYREQGFEVLGFPANDFKGQEPGSNAEIQAFCRGNFGVDFPLFSKITVLGEEKHPLFAALIEAHPHKTWAEGSSLRDKLSKAGVLDENGEEISWNFEKFLVDRKRRVIGRFSPDVTPESPVLIEALEAALD